MNEGKDQSKSTKWRFNYNTVMAVTCLKGANTTELEGSRVIKHYKPTIEMSRSNTVHSHPALP